MKKITCIILLISCINASANLNLYKLYSPDFETQNHYVVNEKVYFTDQQNRLWQFDEAPILVTHEGLNIFANQPVKFLNSIFFINSTDNNTLWKFNGSSFSKVSNTPVSFLRKINNTLVGKKLNSNDILIVSSTEDLLDVNLGDLVVHINGAIYDPTAFCFLEPNKFIFKVIKDGIYKDFYLYNNGEITFIELNLESSVLSGLRLKAEFNNGCLFHDSDYLFVDYYFLDPSLNIRKILSPHLEHPGSLFIYDDDLYGVRKQENSVHLNRINLDTMHYENVKEFDFEDHYKSLGIKVSGDSIYLFSGGTSCSSPVPKTKCTPSFPFKDKTYVLNSNFDLISTIDKRFTIEKSYFSKNSADVLASQDYSSNTGELVVIDNINTPESASYFGMTHFQVLGTKGDSYYVLAENKVTRKPSLFLLTGQKLVAKHLNGLWVSDEWQSQGLSLHTGIRPDKSEYIFASFFIFKEGQPFWVAGSIDMDLVSSSVTMNLAEYKGSSFLDNDPGGDTEQIPFGTLTIIPQGCNHIRALVQVNGADLIELEMQRVTDTTYDDICSN